MTPDFIIEDKVKTRGIYIEGCRSGERLIVKVGGGESLDHLGGSGEGGT